MCRCIGYLPLVVILPVTVPDKVVSPTVASMWQVTALRFACLLTCSVPTTCPPELKVRSLEVVENTPRPPEANVRCAAVQVVACDLPLLTTNVPLAPFEQSENVPEIAVFAFDGAAPAPVATIPTTPKTATPATADPITR